MLCFGLGRLPIAPGTWGSIPVVVVFVLLAQMTGSASLIAGVMVVLAIAGSIVCVRFADVLISSTGKTDPKEIVADEVAGQAVTFIAVGFLILPVQSPGLIWLTAGLGFILFRLFDIIKPWPIHRLENLPRGWGILADDLLAGVFAAIVLILCVWAGLASYLAELFC